jgi:uncharacterized protein (DUF2062 family)
MPRKLFRKYLPSSDQIRGNPWLAGRAHWLTHPNLWHLNRDSVAGAVAIGLFAGLVPGPLQMLAAALLAIPLKKNLPVALITTFYTNPFTIVPLYVLAFGYGKLLLGASQHPGKIEPFVWDWSHWLDSFEALGRWMIQLGPPLAVGLLALGVTLAALGYAAVQLGWRLHVMHSWNKRKKMRAARSQGTK